MKEVKSALNSPDKNDFTAVGLDFVVQFDNNKNVKFKCMLCKTYLSRNGIIKHLQSEFHQSQFLNHCFPSTSAYLLKFTKPPNHWDGTLKLISSSFLKSLTTEICKEIGRRHHIDQFYPLMTQRTSEREFNSNAMIKFVVTDMPHVCEIDFPDTKRSIDEAIQRFIVKSKQLLAIADNGTEVIEIKEPPKKKAKVDEPKEIMTDKAVTIVSHTELERMKVAINIAMELVKNGLHISPVQLEESVKSYYKYELQKSMTANEFDSLEILTTDDLKLLIENYESLCKDEQEKLRKYLTMLEKIEDKIYKELKSEASCARDLKSILQM